mgnify:CR=1 FL=1
MKKLLIAILVLIGLIISLTPTVCEKMGNQLVYEKVTIKNPGAIVVLSGGGGRRIKEAVKQYKQRNKPLFIVTGHGYIYGQRTTELMKQYACQLGVDNKDVIQESDAEKTMDHPKYILPILKKRKINSILVVTSAFHTYRSYLCFKTIEENGIEINIKPSPDGVDYDLWWKDYEMSETVLIEWTKLCLYKILFQI